MLLIRFGDEKNTNASGGVGEVGDEANDRVMASFHNFVVNIEISTSTPNCTRSSRCSPPLPRSSFFDS